MRRYSIILAALALIIMGSTVSFAASTQEFPTDCKFLDDVWLSDYTNFGGQVRYRINSMTNWSITTGAVSSVTVALDSNGIFSAALVIGPSSDAWTTNQSAGGFRLTDLGDGTTSNDAWTAYQITNQLAILALNNAFDPAGGTNSMTGLLKLGVAAVNAILYPDSDSLLFAKNESTAIRGVTASDTATRQAGLRFLRSRGTLASPTIVQDGDDLGELGFQGYDGSARANAASIIAVVDGTPGAGDMPTRMEFYTTPDGSTTLTLRMTIDSDGNTTFTGDVVTAGDIVAANLPTSTNNCVDGQFWRSGTNLYIYVAP